MIQVYLHKMYIHIQIHTGIYLHTPLVEGIREQQNGMCVCVGVKTLWSGVLGGTTERVC